MGFEIYQKDGNFSGMLFGGTYDIGTYGCIICCAAMCATHHFTISDVAGKQAAIQAVIDQCLDPEQDYDFSNSADLTFRGYTFNFRRINSTPNIDQWYSWPIVYYRDAPHAVLLTDPDNDTVVDPAMTSITTLTAAANYWGQNSRVGYWVH